MTEYKTSDFSLTSYALSNGANLKNIEGTKTKKQFVLDIPMHPAELVGNYLRDYSLQKFLDAQRGLKNKMAICK